MRQLDHPQRDVEADDARAARRQRERDVAGAGRQIERAQRRAAARPDRSSRRFQRRSWPYDSTTVMKS